MLRVHNCDDFKRKSICFMKSQTAIVHIGRGSASAAGKEVDLDTATFRCAVISRRHAMITFPEGDSDNGTVSVSYDRMSRDAYMPDFCR